MTGDPIGDALRADADEARAEVRAAGIACPSCGVNAADLPDGHMLVMDTGGVDLIRAERRSPSAKCGGGELVLLPSAAEGSPLSDDDFALWQAAANVSLLDTFRSNWARVIDDQIIGKGKGKHLAGFLGIDWPAPRTAYVSPGYLGGRPWPAS